MKHPNIISGFCLVSLLTLFSACSSLQKGSVIVAQNKFADGKYESALDYLSRGEGYRWLLVRLPDNREFCINLELARNNAQMAIVGKQAADLPLFSIETDDCPRDYAAMSAKGVTFEAVPEVQPFGTGAMLKDLYGNKIYLNQDPSGKVVHSLIRGHRPINSQ